MNVLSLFDGLGGARLALHKLGISATYFASEIDQSAMQIAGNNFPDINQLGDIRLITGKNLPKIDLLIGGSPCQGFSICGKRLSFSDDRSKLFYEYVRILKEIKPQFFLLENVKMKKQDIQVINHELGINSIEINSSLVTAQDRIRLYWTNIPQVKMLKDRGIVLRDILQPENDIQCQRYYPPYLKIISERRFYIGYVSHKEIPINQTPAQAIRVFSIDGKSRTQVALGGGQGAKTGLYLINGYARKLTPIEGERLQSLPDGYTAGVSNEQRHRMIGNGFTVDVICHLLLGLC